MKYVVLVTSVFPTKKLTSCTNRLVAPVKIIVQRRKCFTLFSSEGEVLNHDIRLKYDRIFADDGNSLNVNQLYEIADSRKKVFFVFMHSINAALLNSLIELLNNLYTPFNVSPLDGNSRKRKVDDSIEKCEESEPKQLKFSCQSDPRLDNVSNTKDDYILDTDTITDKSSSFENDKQLLDCENDVSAHNNIANNDRDLLHRIDEQPKIVWCDNDIRDPPRDTEQASLQHETDAGTEQTSLQHETDANKNILSIDMNDFLENNQNVHLFKKEGCLPLTTTFSYEPIYYDVSQCNLTRSFFNQFPHGTPLAINLRGSLTIPLYFDIDCVNCKRKSSENIHCKQTLTHINLIRITTKLIDVLSIVPDSSTMTTRNMYVEFSPITCGLHLYINSLFAIDCILYEYICKTMNDYLQTFSTYRFDIPVSLPLPGSTKDGVSHYQPYEHIAFATDIDIRIHDECLYGFLISLHRTPTTGEVLLQFQRNHCDKDDVDTALESLSVLKDLNFNTLTLWYNSKLVRKYDDEQLGVLSIVKNMLVFGKITNCDFAMLSSALIDVTAFDSVISDEDIKIENFYLKKIVQSIGVCCKQVYPDLNSAVDCFLHLCSTPNNSFGNLFWIVSAIIYYCLLEAKHVAFEEGMDERRFICSIATELQSLLMKKYTSQVVIVNCRVFLDYSIEKFFNKYMPFGPIELITAVIETEFQTQISQETIVELILDTYRSNGNSKSVISIFKYYFPLYYWLTSTSAIDQQFLLFSDNNHKVIKYVNLCTRLEFKTLLTSLGKYFKSAELYMHFNEYLTYVKKYKIVSVTMSDYYFLTITNQGIYNFVTGLYCSWNRSIIFMNNPRESFRMPFKALEHGAKGWLYMTNTALLQDEIQFTEICRKLKKLSDGFIQFHGLLIPSVLRINETHVGNYNDLIKKFWRPISTMIDDADFTNYHIDKLLREFRVPTKTTYAFYMLLREKRKNSDHVTNITINDLETLWFSTLSSNIKNFLLSCPSLADHFYATQTDDGSLTHEYCEIIFAYHKEANSFPVNKKSLIVIIIILCIAQQQQFDIRLFDEIGLQYVESDEDFSINSRYDFKDYLCVSYVIADILSCSLDLASLLMSLMFNFQFSVQLFLNFVKTTALIYLPTNGNKRAILMIGTPDSGKTHVGNILQTLAFPSVAPLANEFCRAAGNVAQDNILDSNNSSLTIISECTKIETSLLKAVTGKDPCKVRRMYNSSVFTVSLTLLICISNNYPKFTEVDEALRQRLHPIYFNFRIKNDLLDENPFLVFLTNQMSAIHARNSRTLANLLLHLQYCILKDACPNDLNVKSRDLDFVSNQIIKDCLAHNSFIYKFIYSAESNLQLGEGLYISKHRLFEIVKNYLNKTTVLADRKISLSQFFEEFERIFAAEKVTSKNGVEGFRNIGERKTSSRRDPVVAVKLEKMVGESVTFNEIRAFLRKLTNNCNRQKQIFDQIKVQFKAFIKKTSIIDHRLIS